MKLIYDIWKLDDETFRINLNSKSLLNRLCKKFDVQLSNYYYKNGKEISWDLTCSKKYKTKIYLDIKQFIKDDKKKSKGKVKKNR